jgi:uncharacterized NAD-dependent epimerase/dehydratase family protein
VILQHAPGRPCFKGLPGWQIPDLAEEVELVGLYRARVLALTLNGDRVEPLALADEARRLQARLGLPVVRPLAEGVGALVPVLRAYIEAEKGRAGAVAEAAS